MDFVELPKKGEQIVLTDFARKILEWCKGKLIEDRGQFVPTIFVVTDKEVRWFRITWDNDAVRSAVLMGIGPIIRQMGGSFAIFASPSSATDETNKTITNVISVTIVGPAQKPWTVAQEYKVQNGAIVFMDEPMSSSDGLVFEHEIPNYWPEVEKVTVN